MTDAKRMRQARQNSGMSENEHEEAELEESMLDGGERITKGNTRDDE